MKKVRIWLAGTLFTWVVLSVVVWTGAAQILWMEFDKCSGIGISGVTDFCGLARLCNHLYCPIFALSELILFPLIGLEIVSVVLAAAVNVQPVILSQDGNWGVVVVEGYLLLVVLSIEIGILFVKNKFSRRRNVG